MSDKPTRYEEDAIASVLLDAGDTRPEIDFRAAVRDLESVLDRALAFHVPDYSVVYRRARTICRRHAAAIAAAKEAR